MVIENNSFRNNDFFMWHIVWTDFVSYSSSLANAFYQGNYTRSEQSKYQILHHPYGIN